MYLCGANSETNAAGCTEMCCTPCGACLNLEHPPFGSGGVFSPDMVEILDGRTKDFWSQWESMKDWGSCLEHLKQHTCAPQKLYILECAFAMQPRLRMSSYRMAPLKDHNVFVIGSRIPLLLSHHGILMMYQARRNISATLFH